MEQVDCALGPAQFDPGGRSLDLDVGRGAVASRALILVLLAALGQLGCGVQRPLGGTLVAGERMPDRQLFQRNRPAAAGQPPPMLQRAVGKPDGARRIPRGRSLVGLADQHVGHHVSVADLLGPFHGTVGPVFGRPDVAAVLVEPARHLSVAGAHPARQPDRCPSRRGGRTAAAGSQGWRAPRRASTAGRRGRRGRRGAGRRPGVPGAAWGGLPGRRGCAGLGIQPDRAAGAVGDRRGGTSPARG
jgi:hypothetical protein